MQSLLNDFDSKNFDFVPDLFLVKRDSEWNTFQTFIFAQVEERYNFDGSLWVNCFNLDLDFPVKIDPVLLVSF